MCNFIMIMILLVTAYTRMWKTGDSQGYTQGYTQSYSKYFRRPRVRTVRPASLPDLLVTPCWCCTSSGIGSQYAPPEAAGDHQRNNRIV